MSTINLLPWREWRRQQRRQQFLKGLGIVAVFAVLSIFIWDLLVNYLIDRQQNRNDYLREHIAQLDREVSEIRELQQRRNQLVERMEIIQALQDNRPLVVRLFDQLVRTLPDGVFYTALNAKGSVVALEGVAESNNHVSQLMRGLDASEWLDSPKLDAVQSAPEYGDQAATFKLTVTLSSPRADEDRLP
jgi:type IV pilus assembly protein PilN